MYTFDLWPFTFYIAEMDQNMITGYVTYTS